MTEPTRKRKRAAISCSLCRRRKIRCNRETPCSNCVRSRNAACIYEVEPSKEILPRRDTPLQPRQEASQTNMHFASVPSHPLDSDASTAPESLWNSSPMNVRTVSALSRPLTPNSTSPFELESLKSRIAELESQISMGPSTSASLPSIPASSPAPTHSVHITTGLAGPLDVIHDSRAFGHEIARGISHKNRLFGQSHWMNGFVVFRDVIEMLEPQFRGERSTLPASIHRAKILARVVKSQRSPTWPTPPTLELPSKDICDELVEHYLRTIETLYRILHVPTFRKEYEATWSTNAEFSTAFIVQLKLVLAIGAIFYDENCSLRANATRWVYEAQTWLSSPNFKSRLGIQYLQTSILLLLARELVDVGSELVWISAGALLREAIYIGLHKEPSKLPRMNFFESEMRRRIWNTILEVNLQFSLISGGPCLISLEDFDTQLPGNFDDEQLMVPDSHPSLDHVFTQTSPSIALRRTLPSRLAVVKFLNDVGATGTYNETLRIDTALRASYKELRHTLQTFRTNTGTSATPTFSLEAIDFIMHRYISSLHIPYFNPSLHEALYAFSRKAVLDSSLKIWNQACPAPALNDPSITSSETIREADLTRLCRCGAGFFRAFTFHASSFLVVELRTQLQEEDSVPRPDLLSIPENSANMVLRTIEAGETGIKGYLLHCILLAHIDGIRRRVGREEMPALLGQAAEEAVERCLPILAKIAGQEPTAGSEVEDLDFQVSQDFMGDWDLIMSDVFNIEGGEGVNFDAFLQ